jgi:hypothetical protein
VRHWWYLGHAIALMEINGGLQAEHEGPDAGGPVAIIAQRMT